MGLDSQKLIESQRQINWIKSVTISNVKLMNSKRKAEVQTLSFESLKRRKLLFLFVMDRQYGYDSARLQGGFSDLIASQKHYKKTLTVDKAPNYQNYSETTTVDAWAIRSWDELFNCTDCKVKHSIFKNETST